MDRVKRVYRGLTIAAVIGMVTLTLPSNQSVATAQDATCVYLNPSYYCPVDETINPATAPTRDAIRSDAERIVEGTGCVYINPDYWCPAGTDVGGVLHKTALPAANSAVREIATAVLPFGYSYLPSGEEEQFADEEMQNAVACRWEPYILVHRLHLRETGAKGEIACTQTTYIAVRVALQRRTIFGRWKEEAYAWYPPSPTYTNYHRYNRYGFTPFYMGANGTWRLHQEAWFSVAGRMGKRGDSYGPIRCTSRGCYYTGQDS